tara:strand:+ start:389 stop:718 length:330 start_codon:yes stop_codon:yes gene_type:complete
MSDLENLFEEDLIKETDTDTYKSGVKSIADRFKSLIQILYYFNLIALGIITIVAVLYILDNRYVDNFYVLFVLFIGFIYWVIHELTFGMIATVIEIREGVAKLNSREDS